MADPIQIAIFDADGNPIEGSASGIAFLYYGDRAGNARTPPAWVELGAGLYVATPTNADASSGVAYVVDAGAGAVPRIAYGTITDANNVFALFCAFDVNGVLQTVTTTPLVAEYSDLNGVPRTPPTVDQIPGLPYLYAFVPSAEDLAVGVGWLLRSPSVAVLPVGVSGTFTGGAEVFSPPPPEDAPAAQLEDAIRAWVMSGSGLGAAHVLWAEQTGARPLDGEAWASIRLSGTRTVAAFDEVTNTTDTDRAAGTEIEMRVDALRELLVRVTFFGPRVVGADTPLEMATATQAALALPSVHTALGAAGLSPFDNGTVLNVTALLGTKFEGRATLEMRFYVRRSVSEFAGYIDTVVTRDFMGPPKEGTAGEIDI